MEKPRKIYRKFQIWVTQLHGGAWVSSVEALPEKGAMFTSGPGKQGPAGEFDSEEAAVEAAMRYIDAKWAQRGGPGGRPGAARACLADTTTGIYLKPTLEDRVQAVARMEAARSDGRTQEKPQKVADRLARTRRIPANRGRKLASSG